jgi:hypothetical protein
MAKMWMVADLYKLLEIVAEAPTEVALQGICHQEVEAIVCGTDNKLLG